METNANASQHHHRTSTPPLPPSTHKHHYKIPIRLPFLILTLSIILLLVLIIIVVLRRRQNSSNDNSDCSEVSSESNMNTSLVVIPRSTMNSIPSPAARVGCLQKGSLGLVLKNNVRFRGVQVFTYKELEAATNNFSEANMIGRGGYRVVYKGLLRDGTVAAVKMLHRKGKHGEQPFRTEVDLLSRLHSPYIVELLGYCADQHHRLLVFEYMPNSSLQHQLHSPRNQSKPLDWVTRLKIALDCARALEFLHEHSIPSIIHCDLKCSNILLSQDFRAKVSDLGLAKTGSDKINGQITAQVLGTTGYLAPEYASTGKLTTKSDVYSYGIVLLQLLTGRIPIDIKRPAGEHVLVSWALPRLTNREEVAKMVDPTLKGHFSRKELIQVAAIAAVCVQKEAEYRPLMTDVVQSLIPLVKNNYPVCLSSSSIFQNQILSPRP